MTQYVSDPVCFSFLWFSAQYVGHLLGHREAYKLRLQYQPMSDRVFLCSCRKCGTNFEFTGTYTRFNDFMDSKSFACSGGHEEKSSPRAFLKVLEASEPQPMQDWKPTEGRNYVNILDYQTARINGMQIDHIGSGLYVDRKTGKKYDYEEDMKGNRHYFEVPA